MLLEGREDPGGKGANYGYTTYRQTEQIWRAVLTEHRAAGRAAAGAAPPKMSTPVARINPVAEHGEHVCPIVQPPALDAIEDALSLVALLTGKLNFRTTTTPRTRRNGSSRGEVQAEARRCSRFLNKRRSGLS